ncbi:MAG: hypothetical protein KDC35_20335 [Acidobacteria bacterium]|nr:hypothetical protein [Acidobacteriota bacterium]
MNLKYATSAVLLVLLFACGGNNEANKVREQLMNAREQLELLESNKDGNPDVRAFIDESRHKLSEADLKLIEDDTSGARELVDHVLKDLERLRRGEDVRIKGKIGFGASSGLVRVDRGLGMEQWTPEIKPEPGMTIETGVRSSIHLNLAAGSRMMIGSSSRVHIDRVQGEHLNLSVDEGLVVVNHRGGSTEVAFRDHKFKLDPPATMEIASSDSSHGDYVSIQSGRAEWVGGGITGTLSSNQSLTWDGDGRVLVDLPSAPILDAPVGNQSFPATSVESPVNVKFDWHIRQPVPSYQIQVANTNRFEEIIKDTVLPDNSLQVELTAGVYFWRVRAISDSGIPGTFSPISQVRVEVAQSGTTSTSDGPKIYDTQIEIIADTAIVKGRSVKDAVISVNGVKAVMNMDGTFSVIVNFKRAGTQWVEIIARDSRGRETISRHKVEVEY